MKKSNGCLAFQVASLKLCKRSKEIELFWKSLNLFDEGLKPTCSKCLNKDKDEHKCTRIDEFLISNNIYI